MKRKYDLLRMQHVKRSPMIGFGEGGDGNFTCQIYVLHAGSIYDNIVKYLFVYIGMFGSCHCHCRDVEESGSLVFQSHLSHQDFCWYCHVLITLFKVFFMCLVFKAPTWAAIESANWSILCCIHNLCMFFCQWWNIIFSMTIMSWHMWYVALLKLIVCL